MLPLQANAKTFELQRDVWGHLRLSLPDGSQFAPVIPVRMFPMSDPSHFVAICDHRGRELLSIRDLTELDDTPRHLLEDELATRNFMPEIRRVYHVSSLSEPCEWDVETDRGRTRFVLKNEEDFHRLGPHRAFIMDSHGIRYMIRDAQQLDAASRRFVEWYL